MLICSVLASNDDPDDKKSRRALATLGGRWARGTPPVGVSRQVILFGSEEALRNRIYWKNNQLLEPFFPFLGRNSAHFKHTVLC